MLLLALRATRQGAETRQRIRQLIHDHPGITKAQLCRSTDLSWGTISHHVRILLRSKEITSSPSLRKVYLYANSVGSDQFVHMRLLREDVPTAILEHLDSRPRSGIQDLSRALRLSRKIVRRHVSGLVGAGLLRRSGDYRPKFEVAAPIPPGLRPGGPQDGGERPGKGGRPEEGPLAAPMLPRP